MDFAWLKNFNSDYATAISALTPFVIGFFSWLYYGIYKEAKTKNMGVLYIKNKFWAFRENYMIDTVKTFEFNEDRTNYTETSTLYTKESWNKLSR